MNSVPTEKIIKVLQYFSNEQNEVSLKEISVETDLANTTLHRILKTLIDLGYVRKTRTKKYASKLYFTRIYPIEDKHKETIYSILKENVRFAAASFEIISIVNNKLFWLDKIESEDIKIKILADKGYSRSVYELDAISRIYLKNIGREGIIKTFETNSFYETGNPLQKISEKKMFEIVESRNEKSIEYDYTGNENGIRRFAIAVYKNGLFNFILSIAEPALVLKDEMKHVLEMKNILIKCKREIEGVLNENCIH